MKFWHHNLTTKVASSFLLLSLIMAGVVGGVAFFRAREALKQAAFDRLNVTVSLKDKEITRWFEDQQRDFLLITRFPEVQTNLQTLLSQPPSSPEYQAAYAVLTQYLADVANLKPNFQEILVLDRSNRIVLSTVQSQEGNYEIATNLTYFEQVETGNSFAPIFYVSPITNKPAVTFATPLRDRTGQRQGVLLANLNLDRIDQIVRERAGLGDSGETYLVGSLVSQNTFISHDSSHIAEFPEGIRSHGIDSAMRGISGSGLYDNYANIPVIGVYRWLNDQDLALLVEMHQEEAFAPARKLAGTIMLVGLGSTAMLLTGVAALTRQLKLSREQLENYSHQLEQKAQEADAANRAKSEFLANMSHELRTPLNTILGFAQLMTRDATIHSTQLGYLDIISRSGEHLLTLINDVLSMSKIEAGLTTLHESSFDLYHLLDSLEDMLRIKAESKGLTLTFQRDRTVPQYIRTDEGKLRQVLINLLGNAIKFTETGSVLLRVFAENGSGDRPSEVEPQPVSGEQLIHLWFEVEDTGPGIVAHELQRLFEPFMQTEVGQQSQQGTGLGLSISRQFIRLMAGDITVQSVLGQGSIFTVDLRVHPAQSVTAQQRPHRRRVIGLEPGQLQYRILIVEDRWENRHLLVKMLEPLGFELREATNGQEGIELWKTWEPHLIWMDMRMPVMDGYEATKQIKSHLKGQATVIIALTASAFEESRSVVLAAGCDDFVRKPFQEQVIFDKIAQHLGVRYIYENSVQGASNALVEPGHPQSGPLTDGPWAIADRLATMPLEWILHLQEAAIRVDADWILQLLDQIPPVHAALHDKLAALTQQFEFDEIIELTQRITDAQPLSQSAQS